MQGVYRNAKTNPFGARRVHSHDANSHTEYTLRTEHEMDLPFASAQRGIRSTPFDNLTKYLNFDHLRSSLGEEFSPRSHDRERRTAHHARIIPSPQQRYHRTGTLVSAAAVGDPRTAAPPPGGCGAEESRRTAGRSGCGRRTPCRPWRRRRGRRACSRSCARSPRPPRSGLQSTQLSRTHASWTVDGRTHAFVCRTSRRW